MGFLLSILFGKYLGAEKLGQYSAGQALVGILGIFTNFGIVSIMAREIARSKYKTSLYLGNALGIKLVISFPLLVFTAFILSNLLGYNTDTIYIILLLSIYNTLTTTIGYIASAQRSLHRNDLVLIVNLINKASSLFLSFLLLKKGLGLKYILCVFIIIAFFCLVISFYQTKKIDRKLSISFSWRFNKRFIYVSFPLIMAAAAEFANLKLDTVIILSILDETYAGIYSAGYTFYLAATLLPVALTKVYFPNFIDYLTYKRAKAFNLYFQYLKYYCIYSGVSIILLIVFAKKLIEYTFGENFYESIFLIKILAPSILVLILNRLTNYSLVALKENQFYFKITLIATILNLTLNVLLIGKIGIKGAAISTFITESTVLILGLYKMIKLSKLQEV